MLGYRRTLGFVGFALSVAASSQPPQASVPPDGDVAVRAFLLEADEEVAPIAVALHRVFTLPPLKDDWTAPGGDDAIFSSELEHAHHPGEAPIKLAPFAPEDAPEPAPVGRFVLDRYAPLAGDTLRSVAARHELPVELLLRLNRLAAADAPLEEGRAIDLCRGPVTEHVVQEGETLWSVARRYQVPLREVLWLNHLASLDLLPGQRLFVARGLVDREVERRARVDIQTSVLLARAKQEMKGDGEASAGAVVGVEVSRPVPGRVTSGFGWRRHPILKRRSFHRGVDIRAPEGTLIQAIDGGKVVFAGNSGPGGKSIILRHPGQLYSIYAHLSSIHVTKGDEVPAGAEIARVGSTGRATAAHLHFAMKRGATSIDPLPFLR